MNEPTVGTPPPFAENGDADELGDVLAQRALAHQALETPLGRLGVKDVLQCPPSLPLRQALQAMRDRGCGSILVVDGHARALGILTRHDLPAVILAPGFALDGPIGEVMTRPVHGLTDEHTGLDAALMMGEHGIRHVPVTRDGRLVGLVSERDLFALHRSSLQQVGAQLRQARDLPALQRAAAGIRALATQLHRQGVASRRLTEMVSHLNDRLAQRLITMTAHAQGIDLHRLCWVALGSEGRREQTLASDQDNALVLADGVDPAEAERIRAWARGVNEALDACGYPLCPGGIMAGESGCCLPQARWLERFTRWIEQGSPEALLNAAIFFDFRALAGDAALLAPLAQRVAERIAATPRMLHQMALNALLHRPPLDWLGRVDGGADGLLDLKLQGTALFVDAARILALGCGLRAVSTRERLADSGRHLGLAAREYESWTLAFDHLQDLRLRAQLDPEGAGGNRLALDRLSDLDRRILGAALRQARSLQQRIELDWAR
jgi:CBS domain-containing protein